MKRPKILVVDDEESIFLLYREEFEDEQGFQVFYATNGEDALKIFEVMEYVENDPIDLVILDINMRGMDGIEVLRRLKTKKPTLPVIMNTAYSEYRHDIGLWASDDYIVKSSSLDALIASIRKHIGMDFVRITNGR
ncbi:MAG: response regulator [Desulfovibrionales bacterium]|nr:response regulator [Desulfovibrionales bacterium]